MLTHSWMTSPAGSPDNTLSVLTNQLYIEMPDDWSALLQGYSLWRYRLSERQNNHRVFADKKYFFSRFTNAYKNQFDYPFYFFTYNQPFAALFTLLPHGHQPKPWFYSFGNSPQTPPEEIMGEIVSPDEVQPHVLLKLMMALCFYKASPNDQERRVCQSNFYLRVKGNGGDNFLTAVEVQPSVDDYGQGHLMTLTVKATTFAKVRSAESKAYTATGAFYELFDSRGQTYLRQLRPNQVASFAGDLYQKITIPGKKAKAAWHNNGTRYKESRSYLVWHVMERLTEFLTTYSFRVTAAREPMDRQYRKPPPDVALPLQRFETIQVVDRRINQDTVGTEVYLDWITRYQFPTSDGAKTLPFELVDPLKIDSKRPLLVLLDADPSAFGYEGDKPNLLTEQGIEDPYQVLYQQFPKIVKQSLNVNLNRAEDFILVHDYLEYRLPKTSLRPGTKEFKDASNVEQADAKTLASLTRNLEVCLSELWLKWLIAGQVEHSLQEDCLPYLSQLWGEWGFVTDNLLLYFERDHLSKGCVRFTDLATPDGKRLLKERFIPWSEIRNHFMARTRKEGDRADDALLKAHFVLVKNKVLDIERTEVMALPNWPAIKAIKAEAPAISARRREAIGVYAGGIWYNQQTNRYIVSGTDSSGNKEETGHHIYQIHQYGDVETNHLSTFLSLLTVTFVRKNRFTVLPYPFDLIRLYRELITR